MDSSIITLHLVPALGVVLAMCMDLSVLPEFIEINKTGNYESMNSLPYLTMWLTCTSWIIYSIFLNDVYVFAASLPGAVASIFYLVVCCTYCDKNERLNLCIGWMSSFAGIAIIAMSSVALRMPPADMSDLWGWVANLTLVLFYASPLSTALRAIADADSSSLSPALALTETAYGALWFVYGIAQRDAHIWAPNAFGAAFGAVQLLLLLLLPRRRAAACAGAASPAAADGADDAGPLLAPDPGMDSDVADSDEGAGPGPAPRLDAGVGENSRVISA
jgi:uncharacterized protein with PQ loop repeat